MIFRLASIIVLVLDQSSKLIVMRTMALGESVPVIPGIFHITFVKNPGGAFGLLPRGGALFVAASVLALVAIFVYHRVHRYEGPLTDLALGLAMGGTAGNLVDRILYGRVIDWLDLRVWPVFNIADSALVVGLVLLSWQILWGGTAKD